MNLTYAVKLQPTLAQHVALVATMERFNGACNAIAAVAFAERTANTIRLLSQAIVHTAKDTGRGIALENLGGIRDRLTARRRQRARLANWSFFQLRSFLSHKAALAGVPVLLVDPKNTSRTCPSCGSIAKANRPTQARFSCTSCGFAGPADVVAARNITLRARAAVMPPMVPDSAPVEAPGTSSRLLAASS